MTTRQTVVYSLNEAHKPVWQYYSMPESIVGGAATLDVARSEYREALKFAIDSDDLPEIREHLEIEAANLGVWLRTPLEHPNPGGVNQQVARQIDAHPSDRDWFLSQPTAGGYPVIVLGMPNEPVSALLEQMTQFDSLIVMVLHKAPTGQVQNVWLSVTGARAENEFSEPLTSFDSLGVTPDTPQHELFRAAVQNHVSRLSALVA